MFYLRASWFVLRIAAAANLTLCYLAAGFSPSNAIINPAMTRKPDLANFTDPIRLGNSAYFGGFSSFAMTNSQLGTQQILPCRITRSAKIKSPDRMMGKPPDRRWLQKYSDGHT
ncbi:MAG: hypothetical protein MUE44_17415 [Oscillatoriaceae cyanobacterium Prado104]|nr:hypothetical protein [Oscillatoriaceae cyanobacterium Prado104]